MKLSITERQSEILTLLVEGKSAKEVAMELDLARGTIFNQVHKMRKKTGARNVTQLCCIFVQQKS